MQFSKLTPLQIEVRTQSTMLFCEKCKNRRLPKWMKIENTTLWLCETCGNFADAKNYVIREVEKR